MIVEMRELIIDYLYGDNFHFKKNYIRVMKELLNYISVQNVLDKMTFTRLVKYNKKQWNLLWTKRPHHLI
jgi:hypothetical protein